MAAPINNKNAEHWNIEEATSLFEKAVVLSKEDDYDFIGEIARDLGTYREVFNYLIEKFPQLKTQHNCILGNLEANCFSHSKKGTIKEATAIVNLKSNYNWTDRNQTDLTTKGEKINSDFDYSKLSNEALEEINKLNNANKSK